MNQSIGKNLRVAMVVPCFNESTRINFAYWRKIVSSNQNIAWIFIDDGSTDSTLSVLRELSLELGVRVLAQLSNKGKAEALRLGFTNAISQGFEIVGFIDVDGSFDASEVSSLCQRFAKEEEWIAVGSSIDAVFTVRDLVQDSLNLQGRLRRALGKIVSITNRLAWKDLPRDTQCGFKFFRVNQCLEASLVSPFQNSWFFEIELLLRLDKLFYNRPLSIVEVPLNHCKHIAGSKTSSASSLNSALQVVKIFLFILRHRKMGFK